MITSRTLENKLSSLYKAGKIVGGVYLGKGQEAFSAALGCCLDQDKDIFAPLIRDQAGRTAFGEELIDATRTYLGSVLGPMKGRDGNIHRGRPSERRPAMISHLGTSVSIVAGMLMARRMKGELDGVVGATCVGDGSTSTGSRCRTEIARSCTTCRSRSPAASSCCRASCSTRPRPTS